MTDQEIKILKDYFSGQYSDGWGEGFAQRGIETSYDVLYLDFWSDDFYIETEDELKIVWNRNKTMRCNLKCR